MQTTSRRVASSFQPSSKLGVHSISMAYLLGPPLPLCATRMRLTTASLSLTKQMNYTPDHRGGGKIHCSSLLANRNLQHTCLESKKGCCATSIYMSSCVHPRRVANICNYSPRGDRPGACSQLVSRWPWLARSLQRGVRAFAHDSNKSDDREEHFHEHREDDSERNEQSGYVIKVSKELMGVFRYIEKAKREKIQEVAHTLRQCAGACLFFTIVRGILGPLVEVFKTTPPNWSKLILMLVSFDSFAICYLAMKASEPLDQLATLATESQPDIMGSIEKEEEMMLNLATELIKLFRRLRNIVISVAVSQFAQIMFAALKLTDPDFVANCSKIVGTWMLAPWV